MTRNLGGPVGIAIASTIFELNFIQYQKEMTATSAFELSFQDVIWWILLLSLLTIQSSLFLSKKQRASESDLVTLGGQSPQRAAGQMDEGHKK